MFYIAQPGFPEQHQPHEIWDHETIDSELERIFITAPTSFASPAVQTAGPILQKIMPVRSGVFYPSALPHSCATGNKAVDDEMTRLLEYAYQAELTSSNPMPHSPEDKDMLCQVMGDSWTHWQRCFHFYTDDGMGLMDRATSS